MAGQAAQGRCYLTYSTKQASTQAASRRSQGAGGIGGLVGGADGSERGARDKIRASELPVGAWAA